MRRIILSVFGIVTLCTPTLTIVACNNDTPLEITNDDIYDEPNSTGKIDKIAFTYIYALPNDKKPIYPIDTFQKNWKWDLHERTKLIGYNSAITWSPTAEFWKVILQKTKNKGIFVSEYQKSNNPIKNAQI